MNETTPNATVAWRLAQLEKKVDELETKVDRLYTAMIGATLTFAVSVGVFAFTVLSGAGS